MRNDDDGDDDDCDGDETQRRLPTHLFCREGPCSWAPPPPPPSPFSSFLVVPEAIRVAGMGCAPPLWKPPNPPNLKNEGHSTPPGSRRWEVGGDWVLSPWAWSGGKVREGLQPLSVFPPPPNFTSGILVLNDPKPQTPRVPLCPTRPC